MSTNVTNPDGSISRVINIGVPRAHPLADPNSTAGPTGLHNLRIGPVNLPRAPTFVVRIRGPLARPYEGEQTGENRQINVDTRARETEEPTEEELRRIDEHVERITGAINSMIGTFQNLFSGYQFMRMHQAFSNGEAPGNFMENFNSQFSPDE